MLRQNLTKSMDAITSIVLLTQPRQILLQVTIFRFYHTFEHTSCFFYPTFDIFNGEYACKTYNACSKDLPEDAIKFAISISIYNEYQIKLWYILSACIMHCCCCNRVYCTIQVINFRISFYIHWLQQASN